MRLENYIKESIIDNKDFYQTMTLYEEAVRSIKKYRLWGEDVVWRGFGSASNQYIIKVINEKDGFRGGWSIPVSKVIELLNLSTTPIFTTKDYDQARFFGFPRVFIPNDDFTVYINPMMKDIAGINPMKVWVGGKYEDWGGQDPVEIAKGYKSYRNTFPDVKGHQEMIVACKEYYLSFPGKMIDFTRKSKFAKIKDINSIKKYGDIVQLYNDYISYMKWYVRTRAKKDANVLKHYIEHYPKSWFEGL